MRRWETLITNMRDYHPEWAERLGCYLADYHLANGQLPQPSAAPWSRDTEALERTLRHDFSRAADSLFKVCKSNWSSIQELQALGSGLLDDMMECHHQVTNLDNVVARIDTNVASLTKRISELEAAKRLAKSQQDLADRISLETPPFEASKAERPELTKLDDGAYVNASLVTCVDVKWELDGWCAIVYSMGTVIYESDACGSKDEAQKLRDRIAVILCTGLG